MPQSWTPKKNKILQDIGEEERKLTETPPPDFWSSFQNLFAPMEWAGKQVGQILTAPWRPRTTEPTMRPPTEEEMAQGVFGYQPTGAPMRAYEDWQAPGFEFDPLFRLPWTPQEIRDKPWRVDVKGFVEELPLLPLYMTGVRPAATIFKQAEKILAKQMAGKTLTNVEWKILEKARMAEQAISRKIEPAIRGEAGTLRIPQTQPKVPIVEPSLPILQNKLPYQTEMPIVKARQQIKVVANELAEELGKTPLVRKPIIKETLKESFWDKFKGAGQGFVTRTYRVEPLLEKMDRFVGSGRFQLAGGKFTQAFWHPINDATNKSLFGLHGVIDKLRGVGRVQGIKFGKMLSDTKVIDGIPLTSSERIGIAMHAKNPDNLVHIVFGNNIPANTVLKIGKTLTPEEKAIVEFMQPILKEQTPPTDRFNKATYW